jgi:hypothetical protein
MNAILTLILSLLPAAGNTTVVANIISALTEMIPLIIKEYTDLVPIVKNVISTLQADPTTTSAQLDTLDAMEAALDAAYETAATAAAAEDAAATSSSSAAASGTPASPSAGA